MSGEAERNVSRLTLTTIPHPGLPDAGGMGPHRGTWLSWPHKEASWPGKFEPVPGVFAEIVRHLVPDEAVHINVADADREAGVRDVLRRAGVPHERVAFHHHPTDDAWCRDHGPIFVTRERGGAPGTAHPRLGLQRLGRQVSALRPGRRRADPHRDRAGAPGGSPGSFSRAAASMSTAPAACSPPNSACSIPIGTPAAPEGRHRDLPAGLPRRAEDSLAGDGIEGDDTDGHIDDLTRFVDPGTVVTVVEEDPRDSNFEPLRDNLARLRGMTDQDGHPLRIVELPMPPAMYQDGQRLPASYANFYIANGVVLLPGYSAERDAAARAALARSFRAAGSRSSSAPIWSGDSARSTV